MHFQPQPFYDHYKARTMPIPYFIDVEFPRNISEGSSGGPTFNTTVFTAASGAEQRNVLWQNARAKYDVAQGIRDKEDMDEILKFFYNVKGKATGFRFYDWSDFDVTNQVIGVGTGSQTAFQIVKTYTLGANTYTRVINKVVPDTLTAMTLNGTPVLSSTYSVDNNTGLVTFNSAPAGGVTVGVAYCEFHVPVRFDTDEMPISLEAFRLESWNDIPLVEIRIA